MAKSSSVTWFAPRNTYKAKIGGKVVYLGPDLDRASAEAGALRARWQVLRSMGHQSWPSGEPNRSAVQAALGFINVAALSGLPSPLPLSPEVNQGEKKAVLSLTLEDCAKIFMAEKEKSGAGDRQVADIRYRLGRCLDVLGRSKPISDLDRTALVEFASYWRSLPKARNQDGSEGEPISPLYASRMAQTAKAFLHWCSEHEAINYVKPVGFDSILTIDKKAKTAGQLEALKKKAWGEEKKFWDMENKADVANLRALFQAASMTMRAYMLLALNCAYANSEIANLKTSDIKVNGETWIRTVRNKTHEKMQHVLWPETVKAIQRARAKDNPQDLYFLTEKGKPVSNHKYNSIPQLWEATKLASGLRGDILPFHNLRHTSANEIKKIAGPDVADIHQGHKERATMQAIYTEKLWEEHARATRKLRSVFLKVFRP